MTGYSVFKHNPTNEEIEIEEYNKAFRKYEKLKEEIKNTTKANTYIIFCRKIAELENTPLSSEQITVLKGELKNRFKELLEENTTKQKEMQKIIAELQAQNFYSEIDVNEMNLINTVYDRFRAMFTTMNPESFKRVFGSYAGKSTPVEAKALLKFVSDDKFKDNIPYRQVNVLLERSKTESEKKFENAKRNMLEKHNKELSKIISEGFLLRKINKEKLIVHTSSYFKN